MASGDTNPRFSEALRIIEAVNDISSKFLINKHQCRSLAARFAVIGGKLKELAKEFVSSKSSEAGNKKVDYSSYDLLLTVLKKGKASLSKYVDLGASIPSVLTRTENRKAFEEIHAELDMMNSLFHFEDFESTPDGERLAMLKEDADQDVKEMSESLDGLVRRDETRRAVDAATFLQNVENVKLVVSEKSGSVGDDLPCYLTIDPDIVEISSPVRMPERKSEHDPKETDGWALVRYGSWLGCRCALKVFTSGDPRWNRNELLKEVRSLMELHHPHIVQLMGFAQDAEKCIILMELMDTDLRHFMDHRSGNGKRPFTQAQEMDIISQIAKGMYYLHEQQYVHGELKCSNILVKQVGDHIDVKISDLRSSQKLGVWNPALFKEQSTRRRPRWTAPEDRRYGEVEPTHELVKKTDVYSFGMVCYEVLTGKLPFQDVRGAALENRIETGDLKQELPADLDNSLRGLIHSCWARDPNVRPSFEEICHLLEFIRSSQVTITNTPPGIAPLQPPILRQFGGTDEKHDPETDLTWGHTDVQDGGQGVDTGVNAVPLPDFVKIDPASLKKVRLIGEGGNAKVYEATWLGCRFAVKVINVSLPKAVQKELKFLIELRHPSVVRLMGLAAHSHHRWSIVMEFMGCSLRQLIDSRRSKESHPFNLHEAVYIITNIALGMAFLHSRGVVHRDLKAANVLVPEHSEHSGSIDVKITDFGVSHLIDSREKPAPCAGTGFWRAPELLESQPGGRSEAVGEQANGLKATDVYSFAMTCYEVLTGEIPLKDQAAVKGHSVVRSAVISQGLRPALPFGLNPDLKLLIEECWDGEPQKRPTFSTICTKLQKLQQGLKCAAH